MDASCTLETAARDRRLRNWQSLRSDALVAERHRQDGSVAVFRRDPEVRRRLDALMAAEADCCSFLRFDVNEQDDRIIVEVTSPAEIS